MHINIHEEEILTVQDLVEGDKYIRISILRKRGHKAAAAFIRVRGESPWWSTTIFGSKVQATPRDKVHRVDIMRGSE